MPDCNFHRKARRLNVTRTDRSFTGAYEAAIRDALRIAKQRVDAFLDQGCPTGVDCPECKIFRDGRTPYISQANVLRGYWDRRRDLYVVTVQVIYDVSYYCDKLPPNRAPVAHAGSDQTVDENTTVYLYGTRSYDRDGNPITYQWTQTGGPSVSLSDNTSSSPTFTSPRVTEETDLTFKLVVNDGSLDSAPDIVRITVVPWSETDSDEEEDVEVEETEEVEVEVCKEQCNCMGRNCLGMTPAHYHCPNRANEGTAFLESTGGCGPHGGICTRKKGHDGMHGCSHGHQF